jgi:integrase
VLIDAANALYPHCLAATKNKNVFGPCAAVLHYAAENDLCPYVRIKKLKERRPEPRALRKEDANRLIAVADGEMRLFLVFLFAQGWRISDTLRLTWQDIDVSQRIDPLAKIAAVR